MAKIYERSHNRHAVIAEASTYLKLDPHGPLEEQARQLIQRAQQEVGEQVVASH